MTRRQRRWLVAAFMLGAAAWLPICSSLLLVALYHHGLDLFRGFREAPNPWAIPVSAAVYWWNYSTNWQVAAWLPRCALAAGAISAAPSVAAACMPLRQRVRPAGDGEAAPEPVRSASGVHGTARWLTSIEQQVLYHGPSRRWGGLVMGTRSETLNPKAPLLLNPCLNDAGNGIVIGGPGAGKTSSVTVPCHATWTGSTVTFDPSRQVGPIVEEYRSKLGHDVRCIGPGKEGFNVLSLIDPSKPDSEILLPDVLEWVGDDAKAMAKGSNDVFAQAARQMEAAILADMIWDPGLTAKQKTLAEFRKRLLTPEGDMKHFLRTIYDRAYSSVARDSAGQLMDVYQKTFSGAYFHATTETWWLSLSGLAKTVSEGRFEPKMLLDGNQSVFVQIPTDVIESQPTIAKTVIGAMVKAVYLAGEDVSTKTLFLLDEARFLGKLPVLENVYDSGRKHGLTIVTMWPSLARIQKIWGKESASGFFGSASWSMFSAISEYETAKYASEIAGTHGVLSYSEGHSRSNSGTWSTASGRSNGRNWNISETQHRLIDPSALMRMPKGQSLVIPSGSDPFKTGQARYFNRPDMAYFGKDAYQMAAE